MNRRTGERTVRFAGAAALAFLCAAATNAQGRASRCNVPMSDPVSFIPLPGRPFGTVSSPDGCWLFVSLTSASQKPLNGVALLKRRGGQITVEKVFPVEANPTGMTITHDGKLLVIAGGASVVFMDVARMTGGAGSDPVLGYIRNGQSPGSVYVNTTADDRLLFVSDEAAKTVTVINLRRARAEGFKESAIVGKIPTGRAPIALTFSPDGRWLYTTSQSAPDSFNWPVECKPEGADPATAQPRFPQGAIIVVDVAKAATDPANSVVARVQAGCNPVRLAISPDGARAYVTARNSNALLAFDTAKFQTDAANARIGTVPVGNSPVGVAVVNNGRQVVVSNSNRFAREQTVRQTLTVIDAARVGEGAAAIRGSLPAGLFPREFGRTPDGLTLFVSNYISSELEVIDLKRMPVGAPVKNQ
jgi:YVTN family beta-propeller protein